MHISTAVYKSSINVFSSSCEIFVKGINLSNMVCEQFLKMESHREKPQRCGVCVLWTAAVFDLAVVRVTSPCPNWVKKLKCWWFRARPPLPQREASSEAGRRVNCGNGPRCRHVPLEKRSWWCGPSGFRAFCLSPSRQAVYFIALLHTSHTEQ